jgi:hypothetical protein
MNSFPPLDTELIQEVEKSEGNVTVCEAQIAIEITIKRDFDTYEVKDQERFLRAIRLFLEMEEGEIKIIKKRRGSVKLTLNLPYEKAKKLLQAIKEGHFEDYGAVDADILDTVELACLLALELDACSENERKEIADYINSLLLLLIERPNLP